MEDIKEVEDNVNNSIEAESQERDKDAKKSTKADRNMVLKVRVQLVVFLLIMFLVFITVLSLKVVVVRSVSKTVHEGIKNTISEQALNLGAMVNEINQMSEDGKKDYSAVRAVGQSISARIIIVNTGYTIVYDNFNHGIGKYIIDNDVYSVMNGTRENIMMEQDNYVRYTFPVINQDGYIDDVVVLAMSTNNGHNEITHINSQCNILIVISCVIGFLAAFAISYISVRDVVRLKKRLAQVREGFFGEISLPNTSAEVGELVDNINGVFTKAQQLEESRQEFVSNVSHELKTPITSMKVLSESLLMQENVPAEMYREFMNDIVSEIDREAQIISDLLTLVKTDKGSDSLNFEKVNMNELMDVILKRLKPLAEKRNIEITFESFREVSADIDKVKLTLALSNLVENGIKYNIDSGWIKVSLNADHKNVYIKVADSGVGIPEDCLEHVFERFYRVDKARSRDTGGTGLGLAITKNIIVMHKGSINVYSEPGKGTTFTVKVPLNQTGQINQTS